MNLGHRTERQPESLALKIRMPEARYLFQQIFRLRIGFALRRLGSMPGPLPVLGTNAGRKPLCNIRLPSGVEVRLFVVYQDLNAGCRLDQKESALPWLRPSGVAAFFLPMVGLSMGARPIAIVRGFSLPSALVH